MNFLFSCTDFYFVFAAFLLPFSSFFSFISFTNRARHDSNRSASLVSGDERASKCIASHVNGSSSSKEGLCPTFSRRRGKNEGGGGRRGREALSFALLLFSEIIDHLSNGWPLSFFSLVCPHVYPLSSHTLFVVSYEKDLEKVFKECSHPTCIALKTKYRFILDKFKVSANLDELPDLSPLMRYNFE